jgi:hypothetical protein
MTRMIRPDEFPTVLAPFLPASSAGSRIEFAARAVLLRGETTEVLMIRLIRPKALLTALTLGGAVFFVANPAQAQRNTYADFPYNQGSLFYRPLPPKTHKVYRRVIRPAPAPPQTANTYPQPNASARQPQYYYNPQTNSYYYYPAPVAPQPAAPAYAQPTAPR